MSGSSSSHSRVLRNFLSIYVSPLPSKEHSCWFAVSWHGIMERGVFLFAALFSVSLISHGEFVRMLFLKFWLFHFAMHAFLSQHHRFPFGKNMTDVFPPQPRASLVAERRRRTLGLTWPPSRSQREKLWSTNVEVLWLQISGWWQPCTVCRTGETTFFRPAPTDRTDCVMFQALTFFPLFGKKVLHQLSGNAFCSFNFFGSRVCKNKEIPILKAYDWCWLHTSVLLEEKVQHAMKGDSYTVQKWRFNSSIAPKAQENLFQMRSCHSGSGTDMHIL